MSNLFSIARTLDALHVDGAEIAGDRNAIKLAQLKLNDVESRVGGMEWRLRYQLDNSGLTQAQALNGAALAGAVSRARGGIARTEAAFDAHVAALNGVESAVSAGLSPRDARTLALLIDIDPKGPISPAIQAEIAQLPASLKAAWTNLHQQKQTLTLQILRTRNDLTRLELALANAESAFAAGSAVGRTVSDLRRLVGEFNDKARVYEAAQAELREDLGDLAAAVGKDASAVSGDASARERQAAELARQAAALRAQARALDAAAGRASQEASTPITTVPRK